MLCLHIINTQYVVAIVIFSAIQSLGIFYIYYLFLTIILTILFSLHRRKKIRLIYTSYMVVVTHTQIYNFSVLWTLLFVIWQISRLSLTGPQATQCISLEHNFGVRDAWV